MTMSESAYRVERDRQTQILGKAIDKAMLDASVDFEVPMLNAVIGALVGNLAESLSAIGDQRTRKQMRQLVDKELSRQVAGLVAAGRPNARTKIITGSLN